MAVLRLSVNPIETLFVTERQYSGTFDQYETLRSAQEIDDPGIDNSFATQATEIVGGSES